MENTRSNKVSGNDDFFIHPGTQAMVDDGYFDDAIELQKFINKLCSGTRKKKTTKKKK